MLPDTEEKIIANGVSPLRIITTVEEEITLTGSIDLDLNSQYFHVYPSDSLMLCTLREQTTHGAPFLTLCSYDNILNIYHLKALDPIPPGRYLIEVTSLHQNLFSTGVSFPANEKRVTLRVNIFPDSSTTHFEDSIGISAAPSKSAFSIYL